MPASPLPKNIGILLFPGFQLLDVAGPLDALNLLSTTHTLHLSILSSTLSPIPTSTASQSAIGSTFSQSLVPTHTFEQVRAEDLDVLIIPGGVGSRGPGSEERMKGVVEWLEKMGLSRDGKGSGEGERGIKWVITVCTGSEILARTGVLDGRRATTNKSRFNDVKAKHPQVNWVAKARWVVDGNIWTSSGISAGIDVTFAWMAEVFGEEIAQEIADKSEYERNTDAGNDRYAERWGAV